MEDAELLFTHDIMFSSNVKVVPQQCSQHITQHIKDTILTSKETYFLSGLYNIFHSITTTQRVAGECLQISQNGQS